MVCLCVCTYDPDAKREQNRVCLRYTETVVARGQKRPGWTRRGSSGGRYCRGTQQLDGELRVKLLSKIGGKSFRFAKLKKKKIVFLPN